jgi:hypothetical protein
VVFLIGSLAARFVGDIVTTIATGADVGYARRLGRMVHYLLMIFVVVLALGTLGIETAILITAITIMIAAFGMCCTNFSLATTPVSAFQWAELSRLLR